MKKKPGRCGLPCDSWAGFLRDIAALRGCGFAPLVALGHTLFASREEIATMWRFTRNHAITEGFHNKMEVLSRQAYGFQKLSELSVAG